jgi:hypothetical protein
MVFIRLSPFVMKIEEHSSVRRRAASIMVLFLEGIIAQLL